MKEIRVIAKTIRDLLSNAKDFMYHYHGQNLLARSHHPSCYESDLYLKLAERIWNPELLMEVATA